MRGGERERGRKRKRERLTDGQTDRQRMAKMCEG